MTPVGTSVDDAVAAARDHYKVARWQDGYRTLEDFLEHEPDERDAARAKLAIVEGRNYEDFKRGMQGGPDKHALLDDVEAAADANDDAWLLGHALFERGMALHIEFVMAEPDSERELDCFTRAAELCERAGDLEAAAMATAL